MIKILLTLFFLTNSYADITQEQSEKFSESLFSLFENDFAKLSHPVKLELFWRGPLPLAITSFEEESNNFVVSIWGELARHELMTPKAWIFSLCHEIGHIIGGAPHVSDEHNSWGSSEGQADFFASAICLPRYYEFFGYKTSEIENIRYATAHEMSALLNALSDEGEALSNVLDESSEIVEETLRDAYPSNQCRVDTIKFAKRLPCWFKE